MIEVKIPETIKVAGFDYKIEVNPDRDSELQDADCYGEHSSRRKVIMVRSDLSPQQFNNTFIHEIMHAVNDMYNFRKLSEKDNTHLADGLHQVIEQLGVRFVK